MKRFCNLRYTTWTIDLNFLKNNCSIEDELNQAFDSAEFFIAPEKVGDGKSLGYNVLPRLSFYGYLYNFIQQQIFSQYNDLNIHNYYKKQNLQLRFCWANKIYKDTQGTIHNHPKSMVFLLYYKVPPNSSDLIFVDSKHIDKIGLTEDHIPDLDKQSIKVHEGLCVLHDGNILHAVSKHNNLEPREVLVFEFNTVFV